MSDHILTTNSSHNILNTLCNNRQNIINTIFVHYVKHSKNENFINYTI